MNGGKRLMSTRFRSFFSHLYHYISFSIRKPTMDFETGSIIVSIDVDVGSKEVGVLNKGKNDYNVRFNSGSGRSEYSVGEIEEKAIPLFVDFFNDLEIPVTFAIRGQLTEVNSPIIDLLKDAPIKHDIGAHGYYHREFTELDVSEAERELNLIERGMKKYNIFPKSFIFPKNKVAHLSLLEKYGYKCYREYGSFREDGMYIEKRGGLYDIHPSFYLGQSYTPIFLNKIVDISVTNKLPFHIWFHPWNFGKKKDFINRNIVKIFYPFFQYAKKKEDQGALTFETMLSITHKMEKDLNNKEIQLKKENKRKLG